MKPKILILLICSVVLSPAIAVCQNEKDWNFELALFFLWAMGIDGDMGIRGRTASVKVDFSYVWDNLQGVFIARFNAVYRNKFSLLI